MLKHLKLFLHLGQLKATTSLLKVLQKIILITYCLLKKKVDCALFGTTNINHLKLIGLGYKKYQINYSQFFNELDKIFI